MENNEPKKCNCYDKAIEDVLSLLNRPALKRAIPENVMSILVDNISQLKKN